MVPTLQLSVLPSPPLPDLPADVLVSIFAFFTLGQRCRVITLVCRHWKEVVYRTLTAITRPYTYGGPLDRYPHLTQCTLPPSGFPIGSVSEQFTRIHSLDLARIWRSTDSFAHLTLTWLTRLDAYISTETMKGVVRLINASTRSLTHLNFEWTRELKDSVCLVCPPLPSLTSLAVHSSWTSVLELGAVLPQLMHLHVGRPSTICHSQYSALVALRHLSIGEMRASYPLPPVLMHPGLTALDIGVLTIAPYNFPKLPAFLTAVGSSVKSLAGLSSENAHMLSTLQELRLCTNLRRLSVRGVGGLTALAVLHPFAAQVHSLEFNLPGELCAHDLPPDTPWQVLRPFTALTSLDLEWINVKELELNGVKFPRLRHLMMRLPKDENIAAALRAFPTLEHLVLLSMYGGKDRKELAEALRAADRRGMHLIEVWHSHCGAFPKDLRFNWLVVREPME